MYVSTSKYKNKKKQDSSSHMQTIFQIHLAEKSFLLPVHCTLRHIVQQTIL